MPELTTLLTDDTFLFLYGWPIVNVIVMAYGLLRWARYHRKQFGGPDDRASGRSRYADLRPLIVRMTPLSLLGEDGDVPKVGQVLLLLAGQCVPVVSLLATVFYLSAVAGELLGCVLSGMLWIGRVARRHTPRRIARALQASLF
jgi:hypothetical protein